MLSSVLQRGSALRPDDDAAQLLQTMLMLLESTLACLPYQPPVDAPHVLRLRDCVVLPGQQPVWPPGRGPRQQTAGMINPPRCFAPGPPGRIVLARHARVVLSAMEALVRLLPQTGSINAWTAGEQPAGWSREVALEHASASSLHGGL